MKSYKTKKATPSADAAKHGVRIMIAIAAILAVIVTSVVVGACVGIDDISEHDQDGSLISTSTTTVKKVTILTETASAKLNIGMRLHVFLDSCLSVEV